MSIEHIYGELSSRYDNDPVRNKLRFVEFLTAEVAYVLQPEGTPISFQNLHHFKVKKTFFNAGAFITVLTEVDKPHKALVLCRGTSTKQYLSLINDLSIDFGFYGVVHNIQDLTNYLKEKKISKIYLAGKSLGGAHAQYLAALLPQKILAVATVNAPGTPKLVGKYTKKKNYETHIIRNNGDYIPLVGGPHALGNGQTKVYHIKHPTEDWDEYNLTGWAKVKKFFTSATLEHVRQLTREIFEFKEYDLSHKPIIKIGRTLEKVRFVVAHIFNIITLGYYNPYRFKHFAEEWIKNNPPII